MTLRTKYSSEEIEVLESYSHRLNNKVHISFPGGAFGDMLWASIFVTTALSCMNDISELCNITEEGRVTFPWELRDSTHFAFKLGNAIEYNLETRQDILFAVYMGVNESTLTDTIYKFDTKNHNITTVDTVLSHCCDLGPIELMSLFETEFNQKLILIVPNESDAEFYGQICSRKTDTNKEYDWIFIPNIKNIKENITDNTLVINPNRFVIDEDVYTDCVKEILDFIGVTANTNTITKMIHYRTLWYNKQPKYIHDYNFKI